MSPPDALSGSPSRADSPGPEYPHQTVGELPCGLLTPRRCVDRTVILPAVSAPSGVRDATRRGPERRRDFRLARCALPSALRVSFPNSTDTSPVLVIAGALTDVQNRVPAEAFGEPAVAPAGPVATEGEATAAAAA